MNSIQTEFTGEAPPQTDKNRKESISPQRHRVHGGYEFFPGRETTPREIIRPAMQDRIIVMI